MTLYLVHYECDVVVEADSQTSAERGVQYNEIGWEDDLPNGEARAHEITSLRDIDKAWHDSIPWGGTGTRTLRELVKP